MAIDPDTGEYGYIKAGADSVTPFKSIGNIVSNVSSIKNIDSTVYANASTEISIEGDGLFAGSASASAWTWYQGASYPSYGIFKCTYYPPESSQKDPYTLVDFNGTSTSTQDKLFAVEQGGRIVQTVSDVPNKANAEFRLIGTIIYLEE